MPSPLDVRYAAQVRAIRARVEQFALRRFSAGEFRDADLERFVKTVVPVVLAGRRQVSALTDAYLSRKLGIRASGPIDTDSLRGVAAAEVYARPFVTVRTKLANGLDLAAAVSAGAARVTDLTVTDMQLAKTHTSQATFQRAGVTRYIRVVSADNTCALCYVASTQTYSTDDLMPIHPGCNCGTDVAPDNFDGTDTLIATHAAVEDALGVSASDARAIDYRKQVVVREHGELGPVLAVKGQAFTGPSAI